MLIITKPLELPTVLGYDHRVRDDGTYDTVSLVDYLLSQVMTFAPAVLEAERHLLKRDEDVAVTLRSCNGAFEARTVLAVPAQYFRMVLARLNHTYLDGQLYGGCARRTLAQGGRAMVVTIHTGNEGAGGFWLRVTSSGSSPLPLL